MLGGVFVVGVLGVRRSLFYPRRHLDRQNVLGVFDSGFAVGNAAQSILLFFNRAFRGDTRWIQSLRYLGRNVSDVLIVSFVFVCPRNVRIGASVVVQRSRMVDCG